MTDFEFLDRAGRLIQVREAVEDDAAALIAYLEAINTQSVFMSREPGELRLSLEQERQRITRARGQVTAVILVAFHAGKLVATIDFYPGNRRRAAHTGEFGMSVLRPYWGAGIGGQLLDALLGWARASGFIQKVKLRVHAGNAAAIALYHSRGFSTEGRLLRELRVEGAWVDVLVMALWLGEPAAGHGPGGD